MDKRLEAYFPADVVLRIQKIVSTGLSAVEELGEEERPAAFAHRVCGDGASNPRHRGAVLLAFREHFNDAKLRQLKRDDLIPAWHKLCVEELFAEAVAAHRRLPALRARALRVFEALPPRSWDSCLLWMYDSADSRLLLAFAYGPLPPEMPPAGGAADFRRALKLPASPTVREDDPRLPLWGEAFPAQKWSLEEAAAAEQAAATLAPLIEAADLRAPGDKADAFVKSVLSLPPRTLSSVYAHVMRRWDDDDVFMAEDGEGEDAGGASGKPMPSLLSLASKQAGVPSDGLPVWRRESFGRILRLARRELGESGAAAFHADPSAQSSGSCSRGDKKGDAACGGAGSECTVQ